MISFYLYKTLREKNVMFKILLLLLVAQNCKSLSEMSALYREVFAYHNETAEKAEYAFEVVDKIYNAFRQWFFTIIFCEFTYFENRILKYTENKGYGYPVLLINSCPSFYRVKVKPKIDKHGKTAYVVTSEELSLDVNEMVIEALLRTGVFKPRNAVIFVISIPVEVDSYFYYEMVLHFQLLWSRNMANSVLIVYADKLRIYAYNAFFNAVREVTDVENLGSYLAHQYDNLFGYNLRISVYNRISTLDDSTKANCDTSLIAIVMKAMNSTCMPLAPRDGNTVGDLLDNGTATGVTKDLLDGYVDFELNSRILKTSYYGYIDTTYPLYQDELCFLTSKAGRLSSFTTAIKLITLRMLFLFIFNVFFMVSLGVITRNYEANILGFPQKRATSVMMDMIKCFLRQTLDITFLGPAFRTVALMAMIYSLIINCVIDSILISAITYPRYKSDISTMMELYETNLTLAVHNRHISLFEKSVSDEAYTKIEDRIEVVNDKKTREIIKKRMLHYAVLLRKSDAFTIIKKAENMEDGEPIFQLVAECPIPCSIVYGLRYGSPYQPKLNNILIHLFQSGILDYWFKKENGQSSSSFGKILNTANENKKSKALTISNLEEVFYVWWVGFLISAFVFAYEIMWFQFTKRLWIV